MTFSQCVHGVYDEKMEAVYQTATEEVTASAEQVREMSEQNRNYAEEVKGAIGTIRGRTDEMKQFT